MKKILLFAAVFALIGAGCLGGNDTTVDEGGVTTTVDENGNEVVVNEANNYSFIMPEDWYRYDNAIEDIQSLGEGQVIVPGIVEDPIDEDIYYFASYIYDEEAQENLISIYKYTGSDYSFERLYKGTHGIDSALRVTNHGEVFQNGQPFAPNLGIMGYDSGYLVMRPFANDYQNPCGESFTTEGAPFVKMNIDEPYSGFTDVKINDNGWKTAQSVIDACQE